MAGGVGVRVSSLQRFYRHRALEGLVPTPEAMALMKNEMKRSPKRYRRKLTLEEKAERMRERARKRVERRRLREVRIAELRVTRQLPKLPKSAPVRNLQDQECRDKIRAARERKERLFDLAFKIPVRGITYEETMARKAVG
jgi:hypothetical protein